MTSLSREDIEAIAERTAELVADRLGVEPGPVPAVAAAGLVDARALAVELGVSRAFVYEHADELGAVRLGTGPRSRLRFDVERARSATERQRSGRSIPVAAGGGAEPARPAAAGGARLPIRLPKPGSVLADRRAA